MKCSLCDDEVDGMGHNPEPLRSYQQRCCSECNIMKVIPARLQYQRWIVPADAEISDTE